MEPQAFEAAPAPHPSQQRAILDGYRAMDDLLGRFVRDNPGATLIFCTALSQGPRASAELFYFRVFDFEKFSQFAGITESERITSAMSSEFHVHCADAARAQRLARRLETFEVAGQLALFVKLEDCKIVVTCRPNRDASLVDKPIRRSDGFQTRYGEFVHVMEGSASGSHRREGALWIRDGHHQIVDGQVPLTDIAPTLLELCGVTKPAHMPGSSLLRVRKYVDPAPGELRTAEPASIA